MGMVRIIFFLGIGVVLFFSCGNNDTKSYTDSLGKEGNVLFQIHDDTLGAFMLGGVYFFQGYGGVDKTYKLIQKEMKKSPGDEGFVENLHVVYRKMFEYPYHRSEKDKQESRESLTKWWEVHNAHEFHLLLDQLRAKGHQEVFEQCKKVIDENGGADADISKIDYAKYKINPEAAVLMQFVKDHYAAFGKSGIKAWDIARYVSVVCLGYSAEYIEADQGYQYLLAILADTRKSYKDWNTYYKDFMLGRRFWGGDSTSNGSFDKMTADMQQGDYSIYKYLSLKK